MVKKLKLKLVKMTLDEVNVTKGLYIYSEVILPSIRYSRPIAEKVSSLDQSSLFSKLPIVTSSQRRLG